MINWQQNFLPFNLVCNHPRDLTNQTPATRSSDIVNHSFAYRPNWTRFSHVTIANLKNKETIDRLLIQKLTNLRIKKKKKKWGIREK